MVLRAPNPPIKIIGLLALPSTAKFIRDVTKYHLYLDESSAVT